MATKCRDELIKKGLGTKILPEAISWHFAGTWSHMPELFNRHGKDLYNCFPKSKNLLSLSVSLPISLNMVEDFQERIRAALQIALG